MISACLTKQKLITLGQINEGRNNHNMLAKRKMIPSGDVFLIISSSSDRRPSAINFCLFAGTFANDKQATEAPWTIVTFSGNNLMASYSASHAPASPSIFLFVVSEERLMIARTDASFVTSLLVFLIASTTALQAPVIH